MAMNSLFSNFADSAHKNLRNCKFSAQFKSGVVLCYTRTKFYHKIYSHKFYSFMHSRMLKNKWQSYFYKYFRLYSLAKICRYQSHVPKIYYLLLLFRVSEINASLRAREASEHLVVLFGQKGDMWFSILFRDFGSILRQICGGQNTLCKILKLRILTANNPG